MSLSIRLTFLAVPALLASSAFAQEIPCVDDADCAAGQFCALVDCGPTCDPDDVNCEPTDCGTGGVCLDVGLPTDCTADSDCAAGDVCLAATFETCSGTGCACPDTDPNCGCDPSPPAECTTETFSSCVPRYVAPCDVAADCGEGFTCEAIQQCSCNGSDADSGADRAAPAPCECIAADDNVCVLIRVECTSSDDCIEGFECADENTAAPCRVDGDGFVDCSTDVAATRICAPPGFQGGGVERATDDTVSDIDDDNGARSILGFNCQASGAGGALPLVGLLALVRRRRR